MTKFSDKCKELLAENGTNVYRFSSTSSLERTALQRMITGKRLPNIEFVKTFCHSLRLSKTEEDEVLELYKIEAMGEPAYRNEQSILHLLKTLKELEKNNYQNTIGFIDFNNIELLSNVSTQASDTELMMNLVLTKEFSQNTNGEIYTNLPGTYASFIQHLEWLYRQHKKKILVKHLIQFQMNASLSNENLDIMNHVFPLFLSDTLNYQVFYYYSRLIKSDQVHLILPYYIITTQYVLLLSADFSTSILLSKPEIIEQYASEFKRICDLARPLFHRTSSLTDTWNSFISNISSNTSEINYLHLQPCYVDIVGQKTFLDQSKLFIPDYMEIANKFIDSIKMKSNYTNHVFFTKRGLDMFCKTGQYYGQVGTFFPPLNVQQRIEALTQYQNQKTFHNDIMLKDSFLSLPENLYFELQGTHILQIIRIDNIRKIDFITVEESSICEAFYQFLHSLPASKYVYSSEDMSKIISQAIHKLTSLSIYS